MDRLPEALVLEILSRLDDSADAARCCFAWKTFNAVSPGLRSINLQWRLQRYLESRSGSSSSSSSSQYSTSPLKRVIRNLVSNSRVLESVRISAGNLPIDASNADFGDDMYITDVGFVSEWLPRISGDLKSLSVSDFWVQSSWRRSEVLSLVSAYCHNLVELELKNTWLSVKNMNLMPKLTTLTLESIKLDDKNLTKLNKCFPNLQVLNLIDVRGLKLPEIHLLNLKTCKWTMTTNSPPYIILITPNLISLKLECLSPAALYIETPMLSHFQFAIDHFRAFDFKRFMNLQTVWFECSNLRSLLAKFWHIETVETLTLDTRGSARGAGANSKFTIDDLSRSFPNMTSLCFTSRAWSQFAVSYGNGNGRLRTFRGYLMIADPSLTFSSVACVLDHCYNLVDVSLLIQRDVDPSVSKRFITKCMTRWPEVKWRWGISEEGIEDSWFTDAQLPKKRSRPNQKKQRK